MRKSTPPKGVASSLALLPRVGCVALANPSLSKVQPRWGRGTPYGLELSNVQCDAVMAHHMVWWRWVGAVPVCPPVSPHKGATIIKYFHEKQHSHVFKMDDWWRCCFLYLGFCNIFVVLFRQACTAYYLFLGMGWIVVALRQDTKIKGGLHSPPNTYYTKTL